MRHLLLGTLALLVTGCGDNLAQYCEPSAFEAFEKMYCTDHDAVKCLEEWMPVRPYWRERCGEQ